MQFLLSSLAMPVSLLLLTSRKLQAFPGGQSGFTLIELLIVLSIVVMGFSVVAVNISSGRSTMELKSAVRDLSSALRYARGRALMTRREASVTFNLSDNSYIVSGREKTFTIPEELDVTIVTAQSEIEDNQGSIRFFPDGSSTGGRITLERGENVRRIDINWLTGQVQQEE